MKEPEIFWREQVFSFSAPLGWDELSASSFNEETGNTVNLGSVQAKAVWRSRAAAMRTALSPANGARAPVMSC